MRWWRRLSVRIPVLALVVTLGPLVAFGVLSVQETRKGLMRNLTAASNAIASHAVDIAEASIQNSVEKIQLGLNALELDFSNRLDQEWALQLLAKDLPEIDKLALIDVHGRETAKSDRQKVYAGEALADRSGEPGFTIARGNRVHVGQVVALRTGEPLLPVMIPVFDPELQDLTGVLAVDLSMRHLLERIVLLSFGESGIVYVLDMQGKIIAHPDASRVLAGERLSDHPHFQHLKEGRTDTFSELHPFRGPSGREMLTSGQSSPKLGWAFMTEQPAAEALALVRQMNRRLGFLLAMAAALAALATFFLSVRLTRPLKRLEAAAHAISRGDLIQQVAVSGRDEMEAVARAFNTMSGNLADASQHQQRDEWLKSGQFELEELVRGNQDLEYLCLKIITFCSKYVKASIGAFYLREDDDVLRLKSSYAYTVRKSVSNSFRLGEGLVGQSALEKQAIVLTECPDDYIVVSSALGHAKPTSILVMPFLYDDDVIGVMELGSLDGFSDLQREFLQEISRVSAITIHSAKVHGQLDSALSTTQQQAEDLKTQQEEMRATNEELEAHTEQLQRSEKRLKTQQEALRASNEELEEKTQELEEQKEAQEQKNRQLEQTQLALKKKAEEMERVSRYKSEFLANMSHELRTPLNSLLLLAQDVSKNKQGNLNQDQIESLGIIYTSGQDLLDLINEILDLSKIEAGMMNLNVAETPVADICRSLRDKFKPLADQKGLSLSIDIDAGVPDTLVTDRLRLEQVVRNLLSNAIKFSNAGKITARFYRPDDNIVMHNGQAGAADMLAISVVDEGIGIPEDKFREIFEAFKQIDTGSARNYGGTGLGLSISRELVKLLGGEIHLHSEKGKGSMFTVLVPLTPLAAEQRPSTGEAAPPPVQRAQPAGAALKGPRIEDDRQQIDPNKHTILIVEDDAGFAKTLYRLCREKSFNCLHAGDGETGLAMAEKHVPDAIILDIRLPGISGWDVLQTLKQNTQLRHIPVHFMSVDDADMEAMRKGAVGFLTKPVTEAGLEKAFEKISSILDRKVKNLLVVEDDPLVSKQIERLIGNGDVITKTVATGRDAIRALSETGYDCVILDMKLPDMDGFEVLREIKKGEGDARPPVIIYTSKELSKAEHYELEQFTSAVIIKGVRSEERLLDETSMFLHRVVENLPESKRKMIARLYDGDTIFEGKQVLLADDDMRNVFAISRILEQKGMRVRKAPDGQHALDVLKENPHVDLVLMDIMMPVMDGYEAIARIRTQPRFSNLPIIAITAKAMKEDRERALQSGASDYLTKPIDIERLLSLMRVWLHK